MQLLGFTLKSELSRFSGGFIPLHVYGSLASYDFDFFYSQCPWCTVTFSEVPKKKKKGGDVHTD